MGTRPRKSQSLWTRGFRPHEEKPKPLVERPYKNGVLQPGWKLDPSCDHDYAPCPFCPPIRVPDDYVQ